MRGVGSSYFLLFVFYRKQAEYQEAEKEGERVDMLVQQWDNKESGAH